MLKDAQADHFFFPVTSFEQQIDSSLRAECESLFLFFLHPGLGDYNNLDKYYCFSLPDAEETAFTVFVTDTFGTVATSLWKLLQGSFEVSYDPAMEIKFKTANKIWGKLLGTWKEWQKRDHSLRDSTKSCLESVLRFCRVARRIGQKELKVGLKEPVKRMSMYEGETYSSLESMETYDEHYVLALQNSKNSMSMKGRWTFV